MLGSRQHIEKSKYGDRVRRLSLCIYTKQNMINKLLGRPTIKLEDECEDSIGSCDVCNRIGSVGDFCGECSEHSIYA